MATKPVIEYTFAGPSDRVCVYAKNERQARAKLRQALREAGHTLRNAREQAKAARIVPNATVRDILAAWAKL